ncbi:hypothetical protein [Dyadobacter pollutisoli]|uniref:Uncharacterized protein n=1 Tax=Dyadobacter pollutisoli TaxID=2910158 RepID=A0A9E8NBT3_9BACT|nr:hypothetical protein [Dyadobacter pollutisoli]WAC12403.1 hypothetical protein ON006_00280 [Dyadobacter pollutisoli]
MLTNQKIISLVKAGLDKSIILTTINTAEGQFDLSTSGLISLKAQKVPDELIAAMQEKQTQPKRQTLAPNDTRPNTPVAGKTPKVGLINQLYVVNSAGNKIEPLDKGIANMGFKASPFGTTAQYEIEGMKAVYRKAANDSLQFVVNTGGSAPEFVLHKAKIHKSKRIAGNLTARPTGAKSGNNTIACNMISAGEGVFKLVPSVKLGKGEYFFAAKLIGSANSIDAYSFGID